MKLTNVRNPLEMIIVMDIDDTISFAKTYDDVALYAEAVPNVPLIQKMKKLDAEGYTFILYTSRGMTKYNNDIQKTEDVYREQIETWLSTHDVPYSKLVFGKPFGMFYVDDKAMRPEEFISKQFE